MLRRLRIPLRNVGSLADCGRFSLRRRKADVARELPEKIEQVLPCELGPTQRETYNALLREIQQGIGQGGANDGPFA